jgi:hypothetical protein
MAFGNEESDGIPDEKERQGKLVDYFLGYCIRFGS